MVHATAYPRGNGKRRRGLVAGIIEADETYLGGKPRHKDKDNRRGRGASGKTSVVGAVQRKGEVRAEVTDDTKGATVLGFIEKVQSALLSYFGDLPKKYRRETGRLCSG